MDEIRTKTASRQNEIKLYMEVADKLINNKVYDCYINFSRFSTLKLTLQIT